ncbi:MAG: riboflavin biosynthesis protein RibF [Candidatus Zixiibacteriota bacterium]
MHVCFDIRKNDFQKFDRPVVSLGTFDGVHLGHQAIIKRLLERSREKNKTGLVVTYEPHPQSVVAPQNAPQVLTTLEEKLFLLEKLGVEETVVINFDRMLSQFEPHDFLEEILVGKLNVGEVIVGHDHAFGKNRSGRIELLAEASKKYNFELEVLPAVYAENCADGSISDEPSSIQQERVSSTKIRKELKEGDFSKGIRMLGHSYPIWGKATKGQGRGKILDYPTLNLKSPPSKLLPKDGVYSAKVQIQDKEYFGMLHIGTKPTFGDSARSIEVHLLDVELSQIDSKVCLFVESWIREVRNFDTPSLLKDQLKVDEKKIKEMFHIN